jgi:hypothetical protein
VPHDDALVHLAQQESQPIAEQGMVVDQQNIHSINSFEAGL